MAFAADIGPATVADTRDFSGVTRACFTAVLFSIVFLQRFAVPFGGFQLQIPLLVGLGSLAVLMVSGRARPDAGRLMLFLLASAAIGLSALISPVWFSPTSYLLWLVIYATATFSVTISADGYRSLLQVFQRMIAVTAALGIAQFFSQFAVSGPTLFTFADLIPGRFLLGGYNTAIPLYYEAARFKSNGFVFLEPSIFSQMLALAIVLELIAFRVGGRLLLYCAALPLAYSGTGLILLAVLLPLVVFRQGRRAMLLVLPAAAALLFLLSNALQLDVFTRRLSEFSDEGTSGSARFISPFWLLRDYSYSDLQAFLFGHGPGSIDVYMAMAQYLAHDPSWAKALFEYGLVGGSLFFLFFGYALFAGAPRPLLGIALAVVFLLLGGALLNAYVVFLVLALAVWPRIASTEGEFRPAEPEARRLPAMAGGAAP